MGTLGLGGACGSWATAVVRPYPSMDLRPLLGDGLAFVEVDVWRRGGVDGEGPAKVDTSICSENGPVEDDGDDTCYCVGPVCASDLPDGSVGPSSFRC